MRCTPGISRSSRTSIREECPRALPAPARPRRDISSEVIVTLFPQRFVRFVSEMGEAGDEVFGGDPRRRTVTNLAPAAQSRHILTCYRHSLRAAGFPYLLDFELIPRKEQPSTSSSAHAIGSA
jgi:hypothetical protein